jgi:hypothetical protein
VTASVDQRVGCGLSAGDPERSAKCSHGVQVDGVAGAIDWFTVAIEFEATAGRGVVSTGPRVFDHEAVWWSVAAGLEVAREGRGGHDRGEERSGQRGRVGEHPARIELLVDRLASMAADGDRQAGGLVVGEPIQYSRNAGRDPRPHEHVINSGEQRPVQRGQGRQLDLLQQVHPDFAGLTVPGQPHLHEGGRDGQLDEAAGRPQRAHRYGREGGGRVWWVAVIAGNDPIGNRLVREVRERATQVSVPVAGPQPSRQRDRDRRARHHAELTGLGNSPRQLPTRHADPHPALHDLGM